MTSFQGSDAGIIAEIGARLARRRLERNWTQAYLAREAGVSRPTVQRLEAGRSVQLTHFVRVLRGLELLDGLEGLLPDEQPSPLEELEPRGPARRRASPRPAPNVAGESSWRWGEDR